MNPTVAAVVVMNATTGSAPEELRRALRAPPPGADTGAVVMNTTPASRTASPRAQLLEALALAVGACSAAGDLEAARVAHEAVGRLLGSAAALPADVVELGSRRGRS